MNEQWRSDAKPPVFTPETFAKTVRKFMEHDARRAANWTPPPIIVSSDQFDEWVKEGFIDESGKALPIPKASV